ncbi:MAG: helix-turn-helix domain-containing protein [Flavobacteriales bacterium]
MPRKLIKPKLTPEEHSGCNNFLLSFRDALEVVGGKWKSPILLSLGYKGTMRFGELQRLHNGIPAKTLSKELKDLETNGLLKRTVLDTMPVTVQYEITAYGRTLEAVLLQLHGWGTKHREYIRNGGAEKKVVRKAAKPARLEVVG